MLTRLDEQRDERDAIRNVDGRHGRAPEQDLDAGPCPEERRHQEEHALLPRRIGVGGAQIDSGEAAGALREGAHNRAADVLLDDLAPVRHHRDQRACSR